MPPLPPHGGGGSAAAVRSPTGVACVREVGEQEEPEVPWDRDEEDGDMLPSPLALQALKRKERRDKTVRSVLELTSLNNQDSYLRRVVSMNGDTDGVDIELLLAISHIEDIAPFRVVPFKALQEYGKMPRSDSGITRLDSEMPRNMKVAFLSHRWLRPWTTKEETEENGAEWAGAAHPDDEHNTKYHLLVAGIEQVAQERGWNLDTLAVWLDFACVDQDNTEKRRAGVRSLLGYMSRCRFVIVPTHEAPRFKVIHRVPGDYGKRAWTRLEALGFYVLSLLINHRNPDLYYTAPGGEVGNLNYVLLPYTMPSAGMLHCERDRDAICKHEEICLDVLHSAALQGLEAAVGPDMVAAGGLGDRGKLQALLSIRVAVDKPDNSGVTALWSASRQGHRDIVDMLLAARADVDRSPDSGLAPIHCAAKEGHLDVLCSLIAWEADMDCQDRQGQTPLVWATQYGHAAVVEELLKSGAFDVATAVITAKDMGDLANPDVMELLQGRLGCRIKSWVCNKRTSLLSADEVSSSGSIEVWMSSSERNTVDCALARVQRNTFDWSEKGSPRSANPATWERTVSQCNSKVTGASGVSIIERLRAEQSPK